MEDVSLSIGKEKRKRQRPRSASTPCVPPQHRLAVTLSALALCAYTLSIIGVLTVLDSRRDGRELGLQNLRKMVQHSSSQSDVVVPFAQWPVRDIHNEEFESVAHPANSSILWRVPKFWSKPLHNNRLMSREQAMRIGTCSVPDETGSLLRGADCPTHQRTIFLSIASYRDFQCRETVESIYNRASFPERIRLGIVDQIVASVDTPCSEPIRPCSEDPNQALCQYKHLMHFVTMDARESVGPVPARHVGHRLYRGEYYAAQADAHLGFAIHWDQSLILELEATGNDMAVLSTYLSDVEDAMDEDGRVLKKKRPVMCNSYWKKAQKHYHIHHSVQPEATPAITGSPQLHPWWSAGFSFARGHFVVNVPYDLYQPMVFSGEEMSIAIRGWSVGYDFYSMEHSVAFHYYKENEATIQKRKNVPKFWENAPSYEGSGVAGMRRLLGLVHLLPGEDPSSWDHRDEDIYGLGGVRQPEQLLDILGFNVKEHTNKAHLCQFVNSGRMHELFTPLLRTDGMGIDYSTVDFRWRDPSAKGKDSEDLKAESQDDDDDGNGDDGQGEEEDIEEM